jgi:hypothetical protein
MKVNQWYQYHLDTDSILLYLIDSSTETIYFLSVAAFFTHADAIYLAAPKFEE